MNGRYRIEIDSEGRADPWHTTASRWRALIATCKSLDRDGLKYRTELAPVAGSESAYTVTVTAWGQPVKRKAQRAQRAQRARLIPNTPLTLEQCTRGRHKAEESAGHARCALSARLTRFMRAWEDYFDGRYRRYDREERERQQKFGRGLARVLAQWRKGREATGMGSGVNRWHPLKPEHYAELDKLVPGGRIVRLSELRGDEAEKGYWAAIVERYADGRYGAKWEPWTRTETSSAEILAELETAKADVEFWRELELLSGQRERFKPGKKEGVDKADDEIRAKNVYVYA